MSHPAEFDPLCEGLFADNAAIIAAGLDPERPSVGEFSPGKFLFYAGRLNEIHGEPGTGKSNIGAVASILTLAKDQQVLCIDPEDSATSAIRRLVSFGCSHDVIIKGFRHTGCPTSEDYSRLHAWAERNKPALVLVDGLAEALAADGLSEDKPDEFLKYCRDRLQPFTAAGAAVLLADHVVKSTESRGRWSRGTGAKMGRYDGVSYSVELGKGYSPSVPGFVRLRISKDRNGGIGVIGQEVAEIHFEPKGEGTTSVKVKEARCAQEGRFIPTAIMEKVSRRLETFPDSSTRDLRGLGKSQFVDDAISELVQRGHLEVSKATAGKRSSYRLISSYRQEAEDDE